MQILHRTAISIIDWNENFYVFNVLDEIKSIQYPYSVFLNSVIKEVEKKKKSFQRRSTEHWKNQHKNEK